MKLQLRALLKEGLASLHDPKISPIIASSSIAKDSSKESSNAQQTDEGHNNLELIRPSSNPCNKECIIALQVFLCKRKNHIVKDVDLNLKIHYYTWIICVDLNLKKCMGLLAKKNSGENRCNKAMPRKIKREK